MPMTLNETAKWELKPGIEIETTSQVACMKFAPNGAVLWCGRYDGKLSRWNMQEEEPVELPPLESHQGWLQCLEFSPDGKAVYTCDSWGRLCCLSNEESPQLLWKQDSAHNGWIRALAVGPGNDWIATAGRDRKVAIWNSKDGQLLHRLEGHEGEIYAAAAHPDGKSLATGDLFGTIHHWELPHPQPARSFRQEKMHFYERIQDVAGLRVLQFSEEGNTLICAGSHPTRTAQMQGIPVIYLIDWKTGMVKETLTQGENENAGFVFDVIVHPQGFFLSVTSGTPGAGQVLLHVPDEAKPSVTYSKLSNCHALALHPDQKRLVVASTNRNSQGNGAVRDKDGIYVANFSPLSLFEIAPVVV